MENLCLQLTTVSIDSRLNSHLLALTPSLWQLWSHKLLMAFASSHSWLQVCRTYDLVFCLVTVGVVQLCSADKLSHWSSLCSLGMDCITVPLLLCIVCHGSMFSHSHISSCFTILAFQPSCHSIFDKMFWLRFGIIFPFLLFECW